MSKKVIIILGMHRSYTSLLASWLHQNGIVMYDRKRNTGDSGLCEDLDILSLHEDVLSAYGMNWLNVRAPIVDNSGIFQKRAQEIWNQKSANHAYWGWKEPRTCVLFKFLWSELATEAKVIFLYRNPADVIESLFVREIARRVTTQKNPLTPPALIQWYLRRHRSQYVQSYLNCWNYYNQCCLHIARSKAIKDRLIIRAEDLPSSEDLMRNCITRHWEVPLENHRLADLMKPSSIGRSALYGLRQDLVKESESILRAWDSLRLAGSRGSIPTQ